MHRRRNRGRGGGGGGGGAEGALAPPPPTLGIMCIKYAEFILDTPYGPPQSCLHSYASVYLSITISLFNHFTCAQLVDGCRLQVQQQNGMETDGASYSESIHTNQTGGSSTYMLQAPAYINPPSFEEFSKRSRAYSRDRLNEDFQDNDVAKDPELHVRTHSQSSLKQQFEQENGFRVRTHSESSSKQQFEQENGFRVRTHSQSGSKHQPEHESDGDVSIEKPSLSSTPSDSEGVFQLEGKMANAIATGTFV